MKKFLSITNGIPVSYQVQIGDVGGLQQSIDASVKHHSIILNYNSSSPAVLFSPPSDINLICFVVSVKTAFNDTMASLSIGNSSNQDEHVSSTQIYLDQVNDFYFFSNKKIDAGDDVLVTLNSGMSTTGIVDVTIIFN